MNDVTVHFFASLREAVGTAQISLPLTKSTTVSGLVSLIAEQHEDWQSVLNDTDVLVAVNQTMVDRDYGVKPGDEVAFLPPVTGG